MRTDIVSGSIRHARGQVVDGRITQSPIGHGAFCKVVDVEDYCEGRQNSAADRLVNPAPNLRRRAGEARP